MSRKAISFRVLNKVVKDMDDVFATKDVSEDPRMRNAHPRLVKHSHYHAFVGGALSDHRSRLGIKEIQKRTARGSRWQKNWLTSHLTPQRKQTVNHSESYVSPEMPKFERIVSIACPACGGNLKKGTAEHHYICAHCGSEYIVRNNM